MTGAAGRIVHISGDFPDSINADKTNAIRMLTELVADQFDQQVISINRAAPSAAEWFRILQGSLPVDWNSDGALRYSAPGRGILHRSLLERLADVLAERLSAGPRPALLLGHKLGIEGIIVARLSALLDVPYALSIQGNSDSRILAMRPDLHARLATVFHGAAVVFPFAPWALAAIEAKLGQRQGPVIMLPCATLMDRPLAPDLTGSGLVSAFHLRNWKIKNLGRLARATDQARLAEPDLCLSIIGGGSVQDGLESQSAIAQSSIQFEGALPHVAMPARLNRAAGFAMPSLRESFGMVFVESLFAGCPILYPAGRAVDGYFDGLPFALRVDPKDSGAIADGLLRLHRDSAAMKRALADWQHSPAAAQFQRIAIARNFAQGLNLALQSHPA